MTTSPCPNLPTVVQGALAGMFLECSDSDGSNQAYGTLQRISKNAESSFQEKRLDLINYEEIHLWCRSLTEMPQNFDDTLTSVVIDNHSAKGYRSVTHRLLREQVMKPSICLRTLKLDRSILERLRNTMGEIGHVRGSCMGSMLVWRFRHASRQCRGHVQSCGHVLC